MTEKRKMTFWTLVRIMSFFTTLQNKNTDQIITMPLMASILMRASVNDSVLLHINKQRIRSIYSRSQSKWEINMTFDR